MAEEYFIRGPEEETASGPFSIDALLTLAEAGKISPDHYYFDPRMESWALIRSNEALMGEVFPEKKRLSLRKKAVDEDLEAAEVEEDLPEVKVDDMLAAAEGHTKETRHVRTKREWEDRAAGFSVPILGTLLLISALSVLYPSWNIIDGIINESDGAIQLLFQNPVVFLGTFDLVMGAFLFLNATEVFPILRFRAAVGGGFFAVVYAGAWLNGDPTGLWLSLSSLGFAFGLYTCTITLNFVLMISAAVLGFAGAFGIIWYSNLVPLLLGS